MRKFLHQKKFFTLLGVVAFGFILASLFLKDVHGQNASVNSAWVYRCADGTSSHQCEIAQRISVAETGQRIVEFVISYISGQEYPRGVVILPLGVLVQQPILLQVEGGQKYAFNVNHCEANGCVGYLDIVPDMLSSFQKGEELALVVANAQGQNVEMKLSLMGFSKTFKELEK